MKYYHQFFGLEIETSSSKLKKKIKSLQKLYGKIPDTICNFCPKKKSVEADCCNHFSPPMYFVEFLSIIKELERWPAERRMELLADCYRSYLAPDIKRPCVLLDNTLCSIYMSRPFSCRMYGQYPKEEWQNRLKVVADEWGISEDEVPMNKQCGEPNVTLANVKLKPLTVREENDIFKEIAQIDVQIVAEFLLAEGYNYDKKLDFANNLVFSASTYLPFDAHFILLYSGPDNLEKLTELRLHYREKYKQFKAGDIDDSELKELENQLEDFIKIMENSIIQI